jgi:hypothetical protein
MKHSGHAARGGRGHVLGDVIDEDTFGRRQAERLRRAQA